MRTSTTLQPDGGGQRSASAEHVTVSATDNQTQAAIADASPRIAAQRSMAEAIQNSPRVVAAHERQLALMGGGLPAQLKAGVEALSGLSMDGVRVHYNSAKPAQLRAHAYAQGADIHLGPGHERHLPHEAWHVVQQAQGRVRPTIQTKGLPVNDDEQLEREADRMGERALRIGDHPAASGRPDAAPILPVAASRAAAIQREEDETDPPDGEQVNAATATRVGVQLLVGKGGVVANVLVAGRPQSPFKGTMGDHVTAFGVHVINLRQAMEGRTLDEARDGLIKLIFGMRALKGMDYVVGADSDWHRREKQLAAVEREAAGGSEDEKLVQLQWMAALYLEVREGVPFSLVNTRAMTAISGRGHGEASQLGNLLAYEPGATPSKKKAKSEGAVEASGEEIDIATKLFDEAAVALVLFNHSVGNEKEVKAMLPAHVDTARLAGTKLDDLMAQIAAQHVASVFPLAGKKAAAIQEAVLDKLRKAFEARRSGDLTYWSEMLKSAMERIDKAITDVSGTVTKGWADTYARAAATDTWSVLELIAKLLAYAVPDVAKDEIKPAFVVGLSSHLSALGTTLDATAELVSAQPKYISGPLFDAYYAYLRAVYAFCQKVDEAFFSERKASTKGSGDSTPAHDMIEKLAAVEAIRPNVEKKVEEAGEEKKLGLTKEARIRQASTMDTSASTEGGAALPMQAGTDEPNPLKQKAVEEKSKEEEEEEEEEEQKQKEADPVAQQPYMDLTRKHVTVRWKDDLAGLAPLKKAAKSRVEDVTGDLSRSIGNSFTVSLRLKEGRIDSVAMRGRPPSPFRGTMGAHATAWLVWVNALSRQLKNATLEEAGSRLLGFAGTLILDARMQQKPISKAQNGKRRDAAKWDAFSLDAWEDHLTSLAAPQNGPWTVGLVQAYAQAILTCANQLPGTTRADKNTDGHGEADAWQKAKADYAREETRGKAIDGSGLFDGSPNSSVRLRHRWLMALALGHINLDEPRSAEPADDEGMVEEKQQEGAASGTPVAAKKDELDLNAATMLD